MNINYPYIPSNSDNINRGKSFRFMGPWNSIQTYSNNNYVQDFVEYNGNLYGCKENNNNVCPINTSAWNLAVKGIEGKPGRSLLTVYVSAQREENDYCYTTLTFVYSNGDISTDEFKTKLGKGETGISIKDITETRSFEDQGANKITINLTDGTSKDVYINNGSRGIGISNLDQTQKSTISSGENKWTAELTNGEKHTLSIRNGEKGERGEKMKYEDLTETEKAQLALNLFFRIYNSTEWSKLTNDDTNYINVPYGLHFIIDDVISEGATFSDNVLTLAPNSSYNETSNIVTLANATYNNGILTLLNTTDSSNATYENNTLNIIGNYSDGILTLNSSATYTNQNLKI